MFSSCISICQYYFFILLSVVNPGFYCCNWLFIGKCYIKLGKKSEAKPWLEKTVEFNAIFFDEKEVYTDEWIDMSIE